MGYTPLPPRPGNAAEFLAWYGPGLERDIARGRYSRWAWRRRKAAVARDTLIKAREADLGRIPDPWAPPTVPPPKRSDAAASVRPAPAPDDADRIAVVRTLQ